MYIIPTNGAPVSIMMPCDCDNNCYFCNIKKEYQDDGKYGQSDITKMMHALDTINKITPNCNFILTGGEPLAEMGTLERFLLKIDFMNLQGANHKVFIYTTLPILKEQVYILNKWKKLITQIIVSRQVKNYINETNDILLSYLQIPYMIDCLLCSPKEAEYAYEIKERFLGRPVRYRESYIDVTYDNLYNMESNVILHKLCKSLRIPFDECVFDYHSHYWKCLLDDTGITFTRSMRNSKIIYPYDLSKIEINNIIITPCGDILDDWEGQPLDLVQYKDSLK